MTNTASTTAAYLVALEAGLNARAGLAGVTVSVTAPKDAIVSDWIVLVADAIDEDRAFVDNTRKRETIVVCRGFVEARVATTFVDAMTRAGVIADELEDEAVKYPVQVGRQTRYVIVRRIRWVPAVLDAGGWVCRGYFDVEYAARIT